MSTLPHPTAAPWPGFSSPGAGFEDPFALMLACHERVQRTLRLLQKLQAHVHAQGNDAQAKEASQDVLRYFDKAAPLHHEDEERHVFPQLLLRKQPELTALVVRLQQDHQRMTALWKLARQPLQALALGLQTSLSPADDQALNAFAGLYADHIRDEESMAYPQVQAVCTPEQLKHMGTDMAARRGATAPR